MTEQEVKELLFEITEYFRAEENGSVEPEQLLKANTLILYKDLYICIDDMCIAFVFDEYYKLEYFTVNQCFTADNFKYKDKIFVYKNFLLATDFETDYFSPVIVKFINNGYFDNQPQALQPNKLLEDVIHERRVQDIGYLALRHFNADCDLTISNPVAVISERAFFKNKCLHNVKITANLNVIEFAAFAASSLSSIQIDGCRFIESSVFRKCSELKTCQLPADLSSIESQIFEGCEKLKHVNIEDTQITSIPDMAFYGCKSLTSITLPNSVSSIGRQAFEGCINLSVISFENFDHVVATNIYNYKLPNSLSIIVPQHLIDQWKEVEEAETPGEGYYSIDHLVYKHA